LFNHSLRKHLIYLFYVVLLYEKDRFSSINFKWIKIVRLSLLIEIRFISILWNRKITINVTITSTFNIQRRLTFNHNMWPAYVITCSWRPWLSNSTCVTCRYLYYITILMIMTDELKRIAEDNIVYTMCLL